MTHVLRHIDEGGFGMHAFSKRGKVAAAAVAAGALALAVSGAVVAGASSHGRWVSGDMHTHTFLTDGSNTQAQVAKSAFQDFGLDWFANSEHGGKSSRDPFGNTLATPVYRWQSLADWSYPIVRDLRAIFPQKTIVQGVEWNVPTHEHASVGIAADEPKAIAEFEYAFDASDNSTTSPYSAMISKDNTNSASALNGIAWLQKNYPTTAYVSINHPSRVLKNVASDFRDYYNAGPDVFIGFEGMPGHQKEASRGGYANTMSTPDLTAQARTYGGADYIVAKLGGVWDSLLGNGLRINTFANSDFHSTAGDFWPGEYEKNVTYVEHPGDATSLVAGLKSGESFMVHGDLIDQLQFYAVSGGTKVSMGDEALKVKSGKDVLVVVKYHSPSRNNNGDKPNVDHIDLIGGDITPAPAKGTPGYAAATNPTTKVLRRFGKGRAQSLGKGWYADTYVLEDVDGPMYLRLRGTNLPVNTPNQLDAEGNPVVDDAIGANTPAEAYKDLWFYSNPLWIDVK